MDNPIIKHHSHMNYPLNEMWLIKILNIDNYRNGLGITQTMERSAYYWTTVCGITKNKKLTDFGKMLVETDPYLEDELNWWKIHINLILNEKDAPVINYLFNLLSGCHFTKEQALNYAVEVFDCEGDNKKINAIKNDINVMLHTYLPEHTSNPENNRGSYLNSLGLIEEIHEGVYKFKYVDCFNLPLEAFKHCLMRCLSEEQLKYGISLNELQEMYNSPMKVLCMHRNLFLSYLRDLKNEGTITLNLTADAQMVYIN